jgi:hypothetical protein
MAMKIQVVFWVCNTVQRCDRKSGCLKTMLPPLQATWTASLDSVTTQKAVTLKPCGVQHLRFCIFRTPMLPERKMSDCSNVKV